MLRRHLTITLVTSFTLKLLEIPPFHLGKSTLLPRSRLKINMAVVWRNFRTVDFPQLPSQQYDTKLVFWQVI